MKSIPRPEPQAALRALARRLGGREAREFPLEEAPPGYLTEAVSAPVPESGATLARLATLDGFVFASGAAAPGEFTVLGTLAVESVLDAHGLPLAGEAPGSAPDGLWRVEAGARLPVEVDRVVPIARATIVGPRRVRFEDLPPAGTGLSASDRVREAGAAAVPRGTFLDARLRAYLGARGVGKVRVVPPFDVAFATVGDELLDPRSPLAAGHRHDLTAPWLEESLARLGLKPVPLGILADSPTAVRDAILHARGRKIEVLILAGGFGEGVTDRTRESLARFQVDFVLDGAGVDGASRLVHARAEGIDIVGLGGMPLETAAGFDLFLGPALLARLGAPKGRWDWSLERWPIAPDEGPPGSASPAVGCEWQARPAVLVPGSPGERLVRPRQAPPFLPALPGQEGWAVLSVASDPAWAYFAPRFV
jgi:molybdopterin biosynthesis enzyme